MRLLFSKGKQKELLKREKENLGLTWSKFAEFLKIKQGKLWAFYFEDALIDRATFNKLREGDSYRKFIVEERLENWGQSKGGKNSPGRIKDIKIPSRDERLAELWGIMLGDGCLQKVERYKVGVYGLDVAGHSVDDKEYLINFVKPLCESLFGIDGRIYYSKSSKCIHIKLDSRKIVDFFEKEGFKAGDKIKNGTTIPRWIIKDSKLLMACLRGLHDTDGSFYRLTNQNSYQICFVNHNKKLLKDTWSGLLKAGIGVSKIINERKIVVTKKSEIEKFYKLIGFHNPKHLNKIEKMLDSPVV